MMQVLVLRQSKVGKILLQRLDELGPAIRLLVPCFKLGSFRIAGISSHRTDVDHASPELDKGPTHLGEALQLCDVFQAEFGQLLVLFFSNPLNEGVRS